MPSAPDPEPLERNFATLNQAFYEERPWTYFEQRLIYLAAVASDTSKSPLRDPIQVGPLTVENYASSVDQHPSPGQSFVAIESEVLFHHAAETLLRLIHAHAEPSPCPWMRMSSVRSFAQFKEWVTALRDSPQLTEIAADLFGRSDEFPSTPADEAQWVRLFATHFLDSSSYNAAKHGMALAGGAARGTITVDNRDLVSAEGPVLSWLAKWPTDEQIRPPRWTRVTRILSAEAYILAIKVAVDFMEAIWIHGRSLHLDPPPEDNVSYGAHGSPEDVFGALGLSGHVLYQTYVPLDYAGERAELVAQFPAPLRPGLRRRSEVVD